MRLCLYKMLHHPVELQLIEELHLIDIVDMLTNHPNRSVTYSNPRRLYQKIIYMWGDPQSQYRSHHKGTGHT